MSEEPVRRTRAPAEWKQAHLDSYISSGGAEGHIISTLAFGGSEFQKTLLLRTVGAKSGKARIVPLVYGEFGEETVIAASLGGSDMNPAWYHNIRNSETVDFQIATQAFKARWREAEGAERDAVWEMMERTYPPYIEYRAATEREIPLIMLKPIEEIAVFTAPD